MHYQLAVAFETFFVHHCFGVTISASASVYNCTISLAVCNVFCSCAASRPQQAQTHRLREPSKVVWFRLVWPLPSPLSLNTPESIAKTQSAFPCLGCYHTLPQSLIPGADFGCYSCMHVSLLPAHHFSDKSQGCKDPLAAGNVSLWLFYPLVVCPGQGTAVWGHDAHQFQSHESLLLPKCCTGETREHGTVIKLFERQGP